MFRLLSLSLYAACEWCYSLAQYWTIRRAASSASSHSQPSSGSIPKIPRWTAVTNAVAIPCCNIFMPYSNTVPWPYHIAILYYTNTAPYFDTIQHCNCIRIATYGVCLSYLASDRVHRSRVSVMPTASRTSSLQRCVRERGGNRRTERERVRV